jgi:hypothetical protein
VIPGTAALTLTTFAPTVTVTANKNVVPGTATLTITRFAPTVSTPRNVTPGLAALTLTTFAPTVSAGGNVEVVPGRASLILTTFAPTVATPLTVIPGPATLTLTTFHPTVETSIDDIPVILIGGDDAPRKRRRKEKDRHDLFREIENTIHELLHPAPVVEAAEEVPAGRETGAVRRALDELLILAEGQHDLLQRAASLRAEVSATEAKRQQELHQRALEQDEEDALIWMF